MKTLIYALCQRGNGTSRLAAALMDIGLFGGHELIGCGWYGSISTIPQQLQGHLYNPQGFEIGPTVGGYVGDSRLAAAFFKWLPIRFQATYPEWVDDLEEVLLSALLVYMTGKGYFVAIDNHLADWWPLVERLSVKYGFNTRSIVLAKDGRDYVQKLMVQKVCSSTPAHYGPVHTMETSYPSAMSGTEGLSRFEQVCHIWADMTAWFLRSGKKVIRVEDFNKKEVSDLILLELYPEATDEQREQFSLYSEAYRSGYRFHPARLIGPWSFPSYENWDTQLKDTFESICGPMMCALGYSNIPFPSYKEEEMQLQEEAR